MLLMSNKTIPAVMTFVMVSAWAAIPPGCWADVVSQAREIPSTQTDWDRLISFAPFDASMGQLTGEVLHARLETESQFEADYTVPSQIDLTAGPTVVHVGNLLDLETPLSSRSAFGQFQSIQFPSATNFDSSVLDLPPNPAGLDLPISARGNSSFHSSSGNGTGIVTTLAKVDLQLDYQYTPSSNPPPPLNPCPAVPEPSGWLCVATGILAFGAARFKSFIFPSMV